MRDDVPQFEGGGPLVLVRNTFLDIEEGPPSPSELIRSKTAPPRSGGVEEEEDEDEADSPRLESSRAEEEQEAAEQEQAPDETPLCRTVTAQWYEDRDSQWNWVNPDAGVQLPMQPGAGPILAQDQQVPPGQQQPQPVMQQPQPAGYAAQVPQGMVLVPVAMAPIGVNGVPMPQPIPEMPQQLSVRQPDRGARWPAPAPVGPLPAGSLQQNTVTVTPSATNPPSSTSGISMLPPAPQPQTLTRAFSIQSGFFRVHWTVDGRKLRGNEKQTVSPPFQLSFGPKHPNVTFKMMIYPQKIDDGKGGSCFRKANGKGYCQLKCEAELPEELAWVTFRISIGSGSKLQGPRPEVSHNFASSAVCGLRKEDEIWNFLEALDPDSMTFVVCLEIVPGAKGTKK
eukprot:CAMPEP_0197620426 /NCGR_PEP_ID=MMETSP1338-20131121/1250_1 /TAXON_ID=43686 ORGANISM="Pelagodinium beii, Strain RCC1491" /NCGR_SAMPLE_ID=MMETSP1338 /ASSEMBLY_ACC=CAM_ASM_000754 /LENGTH=395 /DNA_ID=CAMNT_0043189603 /DNA_START=52 /DNA_END=1239 /DNA_ORIENTATION=+